MGKIDGSQKYPGIRILLASMLGSVAFTACTTDSDPDPSPPVTRPDTTKPAAEYFFDVAELPSGFTGMPGFSSLQLKKQMLTPVLSDSEMVCASDSCSWKYVYRQDSAFSVDWSVDSVQAWSGLSFGYFSKANRAARITAEIIAQDPTTMATQPVAMTSLRGDTLAEPGEDMHVLLGYVSKPGAYYQVKLTGTADSGKTFFSQTRSITNMAGGGPLSQEALDTLFKAMLGNWNWVGTSKKCTRGVPLTSSWAAEGNAKELIVSEDSTLLITGDMVNIGPPIEKGNKYVFVNPALFTGFPGAYSDATVYVSKSVLAFRRWEFYCEEDALFSRVGEKTPPID